MINKEIEKRASNKFQKSARKQEVVNIIRNRRNSRQQWDKKSREILQQYIQLYWLRSLSKVSIPLLSFRRNLFVIIVTPRRQSDFQRGLLLRTIDQACADFSFLPNSKAISRTGVDPGRNALIQDSVFNLDSYLQLPHSSDTSMNEGGKYWLWSWKNYTLVLNNGARSDKRIIYPVPFFM